MKTESRQIPQKLAARLKFVCCIVLSNVFTPTRNALEFKHASQSPGIRKYMKEDGNTYMAVVESIRFMAQIHLL